MNVETIQGRPGPPDVAILRKEAAYTSACRDDGTLTVPYGSLDQCRRNRFAGSAFAAPNRCGNKAVLLRKRWRQHRASIPSREADAAVRTEAADRLTSMSRPGLYAKKMVYEDILRSGIILGSSARDVSKKL